MESVSCLERFEAEKKDILSNLSSISFLMLTTATVSTEELTGEKTSTGTSPQVKTVKKINPTIIVLILNFFMAI